MQNFDLLIKNGKIIDGSGKEGFPADVGVLNGKIAAIGDLKDASANEVIDASGLCVAPGFIDGHSHDDAMIFHDPSNICKLSQGITTIISGNCGEGIVPVAPEHFDEIDAYYRCYYPPKDYRNFTTFAKYREALGRLPLAMNMGLYCAHGTLRMAVMGMEGRPASVEELEKMKTLLRDALENGFFGMSTGLVYPPGSFSETGELIELAKVLKEYDATYVTHIRSESGQVLEAIDEAIEIAEKSGVRVIISHLKTMGRPNWGKAAIVLKKIEDANARGCHIRFDQYPYTACCNTLFAVLPVEYQRGGVDAMIEKLKDPAVRASLKERMAPDVYDWDNPIPNFRPEGIHILTGEGTPLAVGKNLQEYADLTGQDVIDAMLEIVIGSKGASYAAFDGMADEDVELIMRSPIGMVGTDGIASFPHDMTHPRLFGSFPRVLGKYVREKKNLTLEEAIRKMTSLTAETIGIPNKGLLKEGYDADITIFDPETVNDAATFEHSQLRAEGIPYVIVGGKTALIDKAYTGAASGCLLGYK